MTSTRKSENRRVNRSQSHMPPNSIFFEKIVPALLIGLGIIMVILIVVAVGILFGLIPFV